jgi:hypothetical protein
VKQLTGASNTGSVCGGDGGNGTLVSILGQEPSVTAACIDDKRNILRWGAHFDTCHVRSSRDIIEQVLRDSSLEQAGAKIRHHVDLWIAFGKRHLDDIGGKGLRAQCQKAEQ